MLKLNGGLGTSMGLERAKSLLPVKDGKTFLDLIAEQIELLRSKTGSNVRFVLMNSFSTSADTKAHLSKEHAELVGEPDVELLQNASLKIDASTLLPASYPPNPELEWCPPGHGDIYPSLLGTGLLSRLRAAGIKHLFVSNSDNLGATLDLRILTWFASSNAPFAMEVAERTSSDTKGGHLARRLSDGRLVLRESAMCPDADKAAFENIATHKYFNTNNLWVSLDALDASLTKNGGVLPLPLIKNKKTVNPRDATTEKVFQLETAMGAAIECFDGAQALVVPRSRFAPVKTCNDLLVLRSDAYAITPDATVELAREPPAPAVKLDDKHYKLVDQLDALVLQPPSLKHAKSLKVLGAVQFGPNVVVRGDVVLDATNAKDTPVKLENVQLDDETRTF